jgi:hypothetical protein
MPRNLKIAAVQMDAAPSPTSQRLSRAADLVAEAASAGAQLVALPEVFNTGYEYHERNYGLAEPMNGETVTWMRAQAAQHNIHLAGTLMLLDEDEVYNSALLFAPDGRLWRYDKIFPFAWERAYFRDGRDITIADTDLGKLGMMICWDSAHAELWQRYAGKVDAMIVLSSPPKLSSADLVFPDGERVNVKDLGGVWNNVYTDEEYFPGKDMDDHAAWMRVPIVQTVAGGKFRSRLPVPHVSVGAYLGSRNDLWEYLPQAADVLVETGFDRQTKIVDAFGQVIARVQEDGDGFTLAEVMLADETPKPGYPQPKMRTHPAAYFLVDVVSANVMTALYRRGLRRQWGGHMAPLDPRTKIWTGVAVGAFAAGWLLGRKK